MPIIIVFGITKVTTHLAKLDKGIQGAVTAVAELGLISAQVSTHFPMDLLEPDGSKISVMVHGLFDKEERSDDVRQRMAESLGVSVKAFASQYIPSWNLIEIVVDPPYDRRNGFVSIKR